METVDVSLSGCGAFGNSSQCVPEMLSEGNSGGGGGGDGRFPLVSLMLPRILCRLSALQSSEAGAPFLWPRALPFFHYCG